MDFSKERKIVLGFASLMAILILLGVYTLYNKKKSNESDKYVEHTNDVLQNLGEIRNHLFELEMSKTRYLTNREENIRADISRLKTEIRSSFLQLRSSSAESEIQKRRIDTLEHLFQKRFSYTDRLMATQIGDTGQAILLTKELSFTSSILMVMNRFRMNERIQREKSKLKYKVYVLRSNQVVGVLFLLAVVSILLLAILVYHHLKTRSLNESTIRQNWQTLQSILDNTSSFVSIKDLKRRYTLVNKKFEIDETYRKEFYLGKTDEECLSMEVGMITKPTDDKVLNEGVALQYNNTISVLGSPRHYFVVKFPLRGMDDAIIGVTCISTDITEQVNLEEENKKVLERVYDLYNKAPCGYHSVDKNGLIVEMNDTELIWLGYTRDEVIGKLDFKSLVTNNYLSLYLDVEHKSINQSELYLLRKDGSSFPVLLSTEAIRDEKGKFLRSRTIVFDNTDRRRQEDRIKQLNLDLEINNVLLQATNSELESFSYTVSHDLRAPLRSINGYSRILMEEHAGQLDAEGLRILQVIVNNVKSMGSLIDDLLSFSRLGRRELRKGKVNLQEMLEEVVRELPPHSAVLKCEPLPFVKGDSNLLRQVWLNLLSNAIKYSATKPHPLIEIGYRQEILEDIFFVKDNGVGFDMQYIDKLFGVFQRLHRKEDFEGTGVGLAFVHRIISKHGGKVWAESSLGEGATFSFSLPRLDLHFIE